MWVWEDRPPRLAGEGLLALLRLAGTAWDLSFLLHNAALACKHMPDYVSITLKYKSVKFLCSLKFQIVLDPVSRSVPAVEVGMLRSLAD